MCLTYICWTTGIWVSFISRWREKKVHSMNSGNEAEIHENACLITSHMGWGCRTEGMWQYSYQKIHNSKSPRHAWTATILARKWLLCCCHELYGFTNLAYYFNRYIVDVGNYTVLAANSHRQHQDFWQSRNKFEHGFVTIGCCGNLESSTKQIIQLKALILFK